ncbi:cytochrome c oxidase assembly protein [Chloroflexi bacterium TSY]|nr:cytochrome c oxidase assembly protein [Chloroflexi bacterium TSY]
MKTVASSSQTFANKYLRSGHTWVLIIFAIGGLAISLTIASESGVFGLFDDGLPEAVVQHYVASIYAQDYESAYDFISVADKIHKSREDYLRENDSFVGFTLEVARQLASYIEYPDIQVERQGGRATVIAKLIVPDGNADLVREILFAESSDSNELSKLERAALIEKLKHLHENGQLPTFETVQTFELTKERGTWWIMENWAEAVRVHFSAELKDGLEWEFEPVQQIVRTKPGETLQTTYRAKNLSSQPITAKARHIDRPEEHLDSLDILQCFCFIQQTLQPGEEVELPLAFRIDWDVPSEAKDFYVHYEFYPVDSFPEE